MIDPFHASHSESESALDYLEVLRLLSINAADFVAEGGAGHRLEITHLDPRSLAIARIAALVAVGGAVPSYGAEVDAAISAGATAAEIVDVLVGVASVVGLPTIVAAAPSLAMALGYDLEDALEHQSAG